MKITYLVGFMLFGLVIGSCKNESQETKKDEHHVTEVQLNSGAKWKANPETISGIHSMQQICASVTTDAASIKATGDELTATFNLIFQQCTMTGEAHEQLHNYLIPLKGHIDEIIGCAADCSDHLAHIAAYLDTFNAYFE